MLAEDDRVRDVVTDLLVLVSGVVDGLCGQPGLDVDVASIGSVT